MTLNGSYTVGVNVSLVIDCRPVKVETFLSPRVCWDMLQPSVTLHRISRYRKWMDGCLLLFVSGGSMTQRSTSGTGTGQVRGERSVLSELSNVTWQSHISACLNLPHFIWCLFISLGSYTSSSSIKKKDLYFSRQATLNNTKFWQMFAVQRKESCKCHLQNYANHSETREQSRKEKKRCI